MVKLRDRALRELGKATASKMAIEEVEGGGDGGREAMSSEGFEPSEGFRGPRPGMAYKRGEMGLGYYPDASPGRGSEAPAAERGGGAGRERGDAPGQGAGQAAVSVGDSARALDALATGEEARGDSGLLGCWLWRARLP